MTGFIADYILPLAEEHGDKIKFERQNRSIRVAVLDTGIRIDEDKLLKGGQERIIRKQNFLGEDQHAYVDSYGHGTHVVRLLLRFSPHAEIIVAKVSESKWLSEIDPIVKVIPCPLKHQTMTDDIVIIGSRMG